MLIDGHALAFRAFHALREAGLRASNGEPTYAVFGFAQIMLTMIQEQQPAYVAVSFDVGRTFRDDLYAAYKAGRAETPAEFHPQMERIQQLVRALNIPIYTADGYEADDVIGTLARQATAQGVGTIILTGDTDTLQLVDDHVRVLLANPYGKQTTTTMYDDERVIERYKGLRPVQLADLRGLKGDTSDNIPGVKGIGETGAVQLLLQYETVENLYAHLDEVPNRYRKALDGQQEQALFSKRLATIVCDVPVQLDLQLARLGDYDRTAVIGLFQELEIGASSNLIKKLPASGVFEAQPLPAAAGVSAQQDMFAPPPPPAGVDIDAATRQLAMFDGAAIAAPALVPGAFGDYRAITDAAGLDALINELNAATAFAFDTESSGLRPFDSALVGISIAVRPGVAWYVPVGHRDGEQLPMRQVLDALRPFFNDANRPKYAHNAKFDIEMLLNAGVPVQGLTFDTMIAAGLLNKRMGLKDLAFYELKLAEPMTAIEDLIGRGSKQVSFDAVAIAQATPYAAADADMTLRLVLALQPQLAALEHVHQVFQRLEMPLVPVLVDMEHAGITLNAEYIRSLGGTLGERIMALEEAIYEVAGERFNINSGQQLNEVLFERLQLPTAGLSRLKSGGYSITAEVLEQFSEQYPIARLILEYRQLGKLKSTYVDALPQMVNPHSGRVHTSYNQMGAATGRLSSNDPNLQNIPIRTEEGRAIRRGFVAADGCTLVAADYSQIELRILAHVTEDENLVGVFQRDEDIHAATAAQLFGVPPNEVSKNQRRVAKCVAAGTLVATERGIVPIEQLGTAEPGEVDELGCLVAQEGCQREVATGFTTAVCSRRSASPPSAAMCLRPQHSTRCAASMSTAVISGVNSAICSRATMWRSRVGPCSSARIGPSISPIRGATISSTSCPNALTRFLRAFLAILSPRGI
ncbi:DNA polymerase I [Candidatus Gracilibacteria bacterium]|nr:DNA polymerase I [Candidatus Gracilibacteria bacterium]